MKADEWRNDFKSFINELQIPRDDYNGIMEYIDDGFALLKEQEEQLSIKTENFNRLAAKIDVITL